MLVVVMLLPMILTPVLIGGAAALMLGATWAANRLATRAAHRVAVRPRFTPTERARLRALRDRYRRQREDG